MSIAHAEQLKSDLTDKFVVVSAGVPELRRFDGLTGKVKTVNMNGRALVEFDGAVDISWYDIDPSFLKVVTEPLKKAAPEKHAKPAAAAPAAGEARKPAGKSPLELAREQGAKAAAAPAAAGEKKLSPLEMARQQGAGGSAAKKVSPLEAARAQGAAKAAAAPVAEAPAEPAPAPEPVVAAAPKAAAAPAASREKPGSTAEIIALARQQGAYKG
jgi:hypothetical protein